MGVSYQYMSQKLIKDTLEQYQILHFACIYFVKSSQYVSDCLPGLGFFTKRKASQ